MTETVALNVDRLQANFGTQPGLRSISMTVKNGERVVIVGPSGAGKTTLLKTIAGLNPATAGDITIGGNNCTKVAPEKRGAVYMHQTPLLFPHLTVFENVAFPLRVRSVGETEVRERVSRMLSEVQLASFHDRLPSSLSGGQQHRVALARAVVARPRLLLLDEPFSSLDPSLRTDVREVLLALVRQHSVSVLMTTHDMDDASRIGDRIGVLVDGQLLQLAVPGEMYAAPAGVAVARALGMRNVLGGTMRGRELHCALGVIALPAFEAASVSAAAGVDLACDVVLLPGALSLDPGGVVAMPSSDSAPCSVVRTIHRADGNVAVVAVGAAQLEVPLSHAIDLTVGADATLRVDASRIRVFAKHV